MSSLYLIRWGRQMGMTYGFGTQIILDPQKVQVFAPRQSPGAILHQWQSQHPFFGYRSSIDLPLLIPDTDYRFEWIQTEVPIASVNLRINYFDADKTLISSDYFAESSEFHYPKNARSYTFELLNLNNKQLCFSGIWLGEVSLFKQDIKGLSQPEEPFIQIEKVKNNPQWAITLIEVSEMTSTFPIVNGMNNLFIGYQPTEESVKQVLDQLLSFFKTHLKHHCTVRLFGKQSDYGRSLLKQLERLN